MRRALALLGVSAITLTSGVLIHARDAGGAATDVGDPARGAAVFQSKQCWSCHAFAAAGSSGRKSGPSIDRWLAPHAAQMRITPERLAAGRIAFGGRGMPAYTRELSAGELADLVAFVVGRQVTLAPNGTSPVPTAPVPPPETTASAATVARWTKTKRLRGRAVRGARVFAGEGCLSCHRFLGSGRSRFGGADLSDGGPARLLPPAAVAYLIDPARKGNPLMPGYRDLGRADLRALAALLDAARRART